MLVIHQIQGIMLRRDMEDELVQIREDNSKYSVKLAYKRVNNEVRGDDEALFEAF